ncbi:hydrolase [Salinimonas sp. HHU 13199]|uniref:Hydrolase n=1 Tax=Salinimonas profundi TaxID=2729140 RepID=A0ABR8LS53_9ALTE|nr:MBL fold metallo-hydrolase [Salinimonas profundi]MBD3586970.1 hydrolase [Salinimonas profundi]
MLNILKKVSIAVVLVICVLLVAAFAINQTLVTVSQQAYNVDYYDDGKFINQPRRAEDSPFKFFSILYRRFTQKREAARPEAAIPVQTLTREQLARLPDNGVYVVKLGHSGLLLKVGKEYWLVDPIFAQRASPFSFMGPKRFHPPPISLQALPPISRILLSHNHYDHLDEAAIRQLDNDNLQYVVPLGVRAELVSWGISADRVTELGWWDANTVDDGEVILTPTQHFSGRGLTDRNKSLWGAWVINTNDRRLFISGDSGYFDGFKEIGHRYGPFDMAFIENGAYAPYWPDVHMTPAQTVQAALDIKTTYLVPVHNSTFDLAFHLWFEPLEQITREASKAQVRLLTPRFGQIINVAQPASFDKWWREVMQPRYR